MAKVKKKNTTIAPELVRALAAIHPAAAIDPVVLEKLSGRPGLNSDLAARLAKQFANRAASDELLRKAVDGIFGAVNRRAELRSESAKPTIPPPTVKIPK